MKERLRIKAILGIVVCLLLVIAACTNGKTLTQKQQATIWMETYNATYDDVYRVMTNPASTAVQKEIALKKRAILVQVWNPLKLYVSIVETGGTPTPAQTEAITKLIDQLAALAAGGV